jgi:hypothetical protein
MIFELISFRFEWNEEADGRMSGSPENGEEGFER